MKQAGRNLLVSWVVAGCACALLGGFSLVVYTSQRYANQLLGRNDAERTLNTLLTSAHAERTERSVPDSAQAGPPPPGRGFPPTAGATLAPPPPPASARPEHSFFTRLQRDLEDFNQVLREHTALAEAVLGVGLYAGNGASSFRFGSAPERFGRPAELEPGAGFSGRQYAFEPARQAIRITQVMFDPRAGQQREAEGEFLLFFEIRIADYWQRETAMLAVSIVWLVALCAAILMVRLLVMKNIDYRRRIGEQHQLVTLGLAARTLAHEIKNPLSAIRLQTEVIARLCPAMVDRELAIVNQELDRLKLLTDRVGDFLREPAGAPVSTALLPLVRSTVGRMAPGASVEADGLTEEARVRVDAARFRSVIENLVRNALDSGGPAEELKVRLSRGKEGLFVEVLDRGAGLPAVEVETLFDPFYTTKSSGSGIGLAIARRFVEAVGGSLTLENRAGGGAVARVAMPEQVE